MERGLRHKRRAPGEADSARCDGREGGVDLSRGAEDVALGGELVVELAECPGPVTKRILERLVATADEDPGPRE